MLTRRDSLRARRSSITIVVILIGGFGVWTLLRIDGGLDGDKSTTSISRDGASSEEAVPKLNVEETSASSEVEPPTNAVSKSWQDLKSDGLEPDTRTFPESLPEMKEVFGSEATSPGIDYALELRKRLERGHATSRSRELEHSMNIAMESRILDQTVISLATCRENICEMQIAKRQSDNTMPTVSVREIIETVDQELSAQGMVRVSQSVFPKWKGSFSVIYWVPGEDVLSLRSH